MSKEKKIQIKIFKTESGKDEHTWAPLSFRGKSNTNQTEAKSSIEKIEIEEKCAN